MPQLDITTYTSQLFWLFLCFITLLVVSVRVTLPRLARILEERREKIEGRKAIAEDLKEQANALQTEVEQYLTKVRKSCHDETIKAAKSIAIETEKNKNEISLRFKERFRLAESRLSNRKALIMGDVQTISEPLAVEIIQKILTTSSSKELVEHAVAQTFAKKVADGVCG